MATEIRVPTLGESVSEATIGKWFKKPGEAVKADEPLVELETDKVTLEVNAPAAGVLGEIVAKEGDTVGVSALLGTIADMAGRGELLVALLNLAGFALILATALVVGWFKSAPWAGPAPKPAPERQGAAGAGPALATRVREAS